jgi:hypothetical protein
MNANTKPNGCQACHSQDHLLALRWPWGEVQWLCAKCWRQFQRMLDDAEDLVMEVIEARETSR